MDDWTIAQFAAASLTNKELIESLKSYEYDRAEGFELDETDQLLYKADLEEIEKRRLRGSM